MRARSGADGNRLHQLQHLPGMARSGNDGRDDADFTPSVWKTRRVAVTEGLGLVQAVGRSLGEDNPYAKAILSEMERIVRRNKVVTFHDDLSPDMKPLLFSDFIKRAKTNNLQFLAEADYTTMVYEDLPAEVSSGAGRDPGRRGAPRAVSRFFQAPAAARNSPLPVGPYGTAGGFNGGLRYPFFWRSPGTENQTRLHERGAARVRRSAEYVGDRCSTVC